MEKGKVKVLQSLSQNVLDQLLEPEPLCSNAAVLQHTTFSSSLSSKFLDVNTWKSLWTLGKVSEHLEKSLLQATLTDLLWTCSEANHGIKDTVRDLFSTLAVYEWQLINAEWDPHLHQRRSTINISLLELAVLSWVQCMIILIQLSMHIQHNNAPYKQHLETIQRLHTKDFLLGNVMNFSLHQGKGSPWRRLMHRSISCLLHGWLDTSLTYR